MEKFRILKLWLMKNLFRWLKKPDLKILSLLTLFAKPGDEIEIVRSGPDEGKALKYIDDVFNERDNAVIYS